MIQTVIGRYLNLIFYVDHTSKSISKCNMTFQLYVYIYVCLLFIKGINAQVSSSEMCSCILAKTRSSKASYLLGSNLPQQQSSASISPSGDGKGKVGIEKFKLNSECSERLEFNIDSSNYNYFTITSSLSDCEESKTTHLFFKNMPFLFCFRSNLSSSNLMHL